jgi:DNA invertase Pin-like site-specific DNA recombinase
MVQSIERTEQAAYSLEKPRWERISMTKTVKRIAIYARYSTDMQNASSIDDQVRNCRELLHDDEVEIGIFSDSGISGSSIQNRPSFKEMMRLVEAESVSVIITESIDRLSRNQAQIAQMFAITEYHNVAIRTVLEGEVEDIHIGIKGTMNAIELKKISARTRRGQTGAVLAGKFPGGLAYGYKMGREKGERQINEDEATIVRWIYNLCLEGESIKGIARRLNQQEIKTNRGNKWASSTIRGHQDRGTGILQNPIYKGVMVWNRYNWVKHPETGRRNRRENDPSKWITQSLPHLQIIDEKTWEAVQARLAKSYNPFKKLGKSHPPLSFRVTCGECGNVMIRNEARYLICKSTLYYGTCAQKKKIITAELFNEVMLMMRADPAGRFRDWEERLTPTNSNSFTEKAKLEGEISSISKQIIQLEELRAKKQHELAQLSPAIQNKTLHKKRFVEACERAVEPEQVLKFVAGIEVKRHDNGQIAIDCLHLDWRKIVQLEA